MYPPDTLERRLEGWRIEPGANQSWLGRVALEGPLLGSQRVSILGSGPLKPVQEHEALCTSKRVKRGPPRGH